MSKFKVGQKVRVLDSEYKGKNYSIAKMIGKVCEVKGGPCCNCYEIWQPNKLDWWFFGENELEAVDNEKSLTKRVEELERQVKELTEKSKAQDAQPLASRFTDREKEFLKFIKKEYKWIARDKGGDLYTYTNKPVKVESYWSSGKYARCFSPFINLKFKGIQWSDAEPVEIDKVVDRD